jgi:MSHA type pilus biogenesis protein MshL
MHLDKWVFICWLSSHITACDITNHRVYHDTGLELQEEDYTKLSQPPSEKKIHQIFRPASPPKTQCPLLTLEMKKPVTVTLHEGTPLKEVLQELSRQTGVGMVQSPRLKNDMGGILYTASQVPFIDVLKDICALLNLRFQIQGNRILIEPDEPYLMTYNVQFLSHTRKSENRISVSTDVFTPLENQSRAENGSNSTLSGNTVMDFWVELEQNMKMILVPDKLATQKGPQYYSLHKQGGLVTVFGNARQQTQVAEYFKKLKEATSTQVIIEAKIIEVVLDNEFKSGINWSQLGDHIHLSAPMGSLVAARHLHKEFLQNSDVFTFAVDHENFASVLKLVKKFGTVRTLSNPRLTVMNNQPAMLKVATNEVFFHLEFERYFQTDGRPDIENISSDAMTVPIGLVMVVQPSVNLQTGEITMILRPTISRVQKEVEDPAVAIKSKQKVKSTVPVVQVRELDSVLKLKSGQVVVMGGLMEDCASYKTASIPGIDSIPIFGEFAKGKDDDRKVTELVIFLTAHITEDPYISEADTRLYNTYTEDPRPLQF